MLFPNLVLNAPASYAAMEVGCTGANLTVSQGETSGEQAIALGCDLIRAGRADIVLAGGGDELAEVGAVRRHVLGVVDLLLGGGPAKRETGAVAAPLLELRPVLLGDADKAKDDRGGQREGQRGDEIERRRRVDGI